MSDLSGRIIAFVGVGPYISTSSVYITTGPITTDMEPDGPVPCDFAVVGEGPGSEEVAARRGFVGPSGKILWPMIEHLAGLKRKGVYVDNLSLTRLDDTAEEKLSPEQFELCRTALLGRLKTVKPKVILAVGALAAKALIGDRYSRMEVNNGMHYRNDELECHVVPCWHPAAALREGGMGDKDVLAYTGFAISQFTTVLPRMSVGHSIPSPEVSSYPVIVPMPTETHIGLDTEGTPDNPVCATWAQRDKRVWLYPDAVPEFMQMVRDRDICLIFHNAPWDWEVLEAMGVEKPWTIPYLDTMEMAYLMQTEPRGLKDLAERHLGMRLKSWEELVMPYHDKLITEYAAGLVEGSTKTITHSPKGRLLKTPKLLLEDESLAPIKRALKNPKLLRERLPDFPPPSLDLIPFEEQLEYATMDAWVTYILCIDRLDPR